MALNSDAVVATNQYKILYKAFDASNALPTLATDTYNTDPAGFTDPGYTSGGLSLGVDQTRNAIRMDQSFFNIRNPITEMNFTIGTELGQFTPANLLFATGLGSVDTVAPGSGTKGNDDWELTDDFTDAFYTVFGRVKQVNNEPLTIAGWKMQATGAVDTTFSPDNAATIALEFTGTPDTSTSPARIATVRSAVPATA